MNQDDIASDPRREHAGPGIAAAVERLLAVVEEENTRLAAGRIVSVEESVQKKSRALLELTRLARVPLMGGRGEPGLAHRLAALRESLSRNEALLAMHLRAAREIGVILAASIAREEWDGTYAAPAPAGRRGQP